MSDLRSRWATSVRTAVERADAAGLGRVELTGDVGTWRGLLSILDRRDLDLGDPFMTCESGDGRFEVRLRYPTLKQAQDAHTALLAVTGGSR